MVKIALDDSRYIDRLRGLSILRVVLVHLGLSWFFLPYSSYIGVFLPILFFCSGFIQLSLFERAKSSAEFLVSRCIGILIPFYIVYFGATAISLIIFGVEGVDLYGLMVNGIFVSPEVSQMPYPLGQIWFLRVLLVCVLISPLLYFLSRRHPLVLLFPVLLAIIFSTIKLFDNGFGVPPVGEYNLLQVQIYGSYFFLGAYFSTISWRSYSSIMFMGSIACVCFSLFLFKHFSLDANYFTYAFVPNLYHYILGLACIFFVNSISSYIDFIFNRIGFADRFVIIFSVNAYSIYLLHSLVVVVVEKYLGLVDVAASLYLVISKVFIVILITVLISIPLTKLTKFSIAAVRRLILPSDHAGAFLPKKHEKI